MQVRKIVVIMFVCMVGLVAAKDGLAFAAEDPDVIKLKDAGNGDDSRLSLQLDAMYMGVKGLNSQDVSVVENSPIFGIDNLSTNRQDTNVGARATFRGEATYKINGLWRVGASGWFFDNDKTVGGTVGNSEDPTIGSFIHMWNRNFRNYESEGNPENIFSVTNKLSMWNVDLFGTRNIVSGGKGSFDMNIGAKVAKPHHEEHRSFTHPEGAVEADFLTSDHEANYSLLGGPLLGVQGKYKICGPVSLEGFLNQSVLMGSVKEQGFFIDGEVLPDGTKVLEGGSISFHKNQTVAIPVTELKAKFVFDVTKNIAVDVGGFLSVFYDMPTAPQFINDGDEGDPRNATGWYSTVSTLSFVGATFGVTLSY